MGQKHWADEERDCLLKYIVPHSFYANGYQDPMNGGMGFADLAKIMQAKMRAEGFENREYTETILYQKWYQLMSRMGKQGQSGPTGVMLPNQRLEKIKEFRAWLNENDGNDEAENEVEDEGEIPEDGNLDLNNSSPRAQYHHQPSQSRPRPQPHQHSHDQEAEIPHPSKPTPYFYPAPQLSSGGTTRRVYDEKNIGPPANPYRRHERSPRAHQPNQYPPEPKGPHIYPYSRTQPRSSKEHDTYRRGGFGDQPDETRRTSYFHPYPQMSSGGTMRRIYDDENTCPPETPNAASLHAKHKEPKFNLPHHPEDKAPTFSNKRSYEERVAEYEASCVEKARQDGRARRPLREDGLGDFEGNDNHDGYVDPRSIIQKRNEERAAGFLASQARRSAQAGRARAERVHLERARREEIFGDFDDDDEEDDNDDYPLPPAKRLKSSPFKPNPMTPVKKTPSTPVAKRTSENRAFAMKPSTSMTRLAIPAKRRAHSPADDDGEEDDAIREDEDENDDEWAEEDIDPDLVENGGESPIGVPRFDVQEAATRPLTVPKQYNVGLSFLPSGVDIRSLPHFQGGFVYPGDEVVEDEDDEDVEGGDDSATA